VVELVGHQELGGRTATGAWLAGDTDEVRLLIEGCMSLLEPPGKELVKTRRSSRNSDGSCSELDAQYGSSNTLHRTA